MTDTANLGLPFLEAAQAQKHVTHNEALRMLDALVMLSVKDRDLALPPDEPVEGERYIVAADGAEAFAEHDDAIAHFNDGAWSFYPPRMGWICYVEDERALLSWDGAAWVSATETTGDISELQNISRFGLNTAADAGNPFSVRLNNVLWVARPEGEGGDGTLRYKLSKESAAHTLSFLLQDNFSGRAEIGLTGDNDFHFKTSPDGAEWVDALLLDHATGATKVNAAFHLTGVVSPPPMTADVNDYNPHGLAGASVLRIGADAPRVMTGLSGGGAGRVLVLVNAGAHAITLISGHTSSASHNRFDFGKNLVLAPSASALIWYDAAQVCWRLLAGA